MTGYHIGLEEIADKDFRALYEIRRRDALFAFGVPEEDDSVLLGRDHLGNIPLFYKVTNGSVRFSPFIKDLLDGSETIDDEGLRAYLSLGTTKVVSLFKEISLVPPGTVLKVFPDGRVETLYQYRFTPRRLSGWSFKRCTDEADRLLTEAARRTLKEEVVGLYLSGGIDSVLTGIYLKKAGAKINAYTATPWGAKSDEARFATSNARTVGALSHEMRPLDAARFAQYIAHAEQWYGNPNGATSQLAIECLLEETGVKDERQVFFAQNADTATTSVPDQSLLYFLHFAPYALRKRLHAALRQPSLADAFASFRTTGFITHIPHKNSYRGHSALQKLAIAGMLFGHSPVDGEIIILPALRRGQRVSNIFYDMDVIEFCLGLPLRHRLGFSPESKLRIAIVKKVFKALASRYVSDAIINRKKGLTVPTSRDEAARAFFNSLPYKAGAHYLSLPAHRLAAEALRRWALGSHSPAATALFDEETVPCSVGILTHNSEATLRRALESVRAFSEVVLCDGGSNDRTKEIAQEFGARVIAQDERYLHRGKIRDFSGVRNQLIAASANPWMLHLDADEYLSPQSVEEIRAIIRSHRAGDPLVYRLPRKTVIEGRVIDCATVYPSYQMRLFNKEGVHGFIKPVHERLSLKEGVRIGTLKHPQMVPIDMTKKQMFDKQRYYLRIEAERHANDTLTQWLRGPLKDSLRSSASYLVRHVRMLLFCRGVHMPLWVEWMHHWYNWKLITATGRKFFSRDTQR